MLIVSCNAARKGIAMNPELEATVRDAYGIFAGYRVENSLSVCHCPCCMTVETGRELLKTPLRQISSGLLSEYTNSAHGWDDGLVAREMRYFLPRYLELIAANDPPEDGGMAVCLRRLAYAQWRKKWPEAEVDVLERFFDQFALACLKKLETEACPSGWRLAFDFRSVLTLAVTADADLDRILASWKEAEDPSAAIHMASLRFDVSNDGRGPYLYSPYLDERYSDAAYSIGAFLAHREVVEKIEVACFLATGIHWENRWEKFLSDALRIDLHSYRIAQPWGPV
jgi:hypothetical protein